MSGLKLYKQLTDVGESKEKAEVLANAFEELEKRYPEVTDLATKASVKESELRLQKEIKEVEVRILTVINRQTWSMLGGIALLGVVFKLADMFIK